MTGVLISKSPSVLVRASEAPITDAGDITLSSYDKMYMSDAAVHLYFWFEHPIQEPVETIKSGLSRALVHYYPVSGRLAAGAADDEVVIKCTGEGVSVVSASANCAIKDVPDLCDPWLQEELGVFYPGEGFSYSEPLLLMQVTVFSCGGFVLGVTWHHYLGDGTGLGQFLQAVGELARGLPSPSVVPVRSQDSLKLGVPSFSTYYMWYKDVKGNLQPSLMVFQDITVPSSLIDRIKNKYSSVSFGRPCSAFDAVAAVLWRCRTRAIMTDPEARAALTFVTNARKYAGADEGYYGNCVSMQIATATCGEVANGDLMELLRMIQCAKKRVPDESDIDELHQLLGYNLIGMSCWQNIGLEAADFGAGRAARVTCYWQDRTSLPFCVPCLPCKDDDYNVMCICVREEHAAAFHHELANMCRSYNPLSLSLSLSSKL